jgi:hypothetical protein
MTDDTTIDQPAPVDAAADYATGLTPWTGPTTEPLSPANLLPRLVQSAPGLLRLAAMSGLHLAEWTLKATVETGGDVVRSLAKGELPTDTLTAIVGDLRTVGRQALGLHQQGDTVLPAKVLPAGSTGEELRNRGAALLYRSADVWFTEEVHPAYERILDELSPDEARILRFLAIEGPQPAIDVRTGRPLGIGSELVAGGLSMIGLRAGVRDMSRTSAFQNNLFRLGLIWFSREEVDPTRYQVLEVQPEVAEARQKAGRMAKIVRRSIHLTPFGEDFCGVCLPLDDPSN